MTPDDAQLIGITAGAIGLILAFAIPMASTQERIIASREKECAAIFEQYPRVTYCGLSESLSPSDIACGPPKRLTVSICAKAISRKRAPSSKPSTRSRSRTSHWLPDGWAES